MTSFERNSDHVVMASYAPLLVRVEDRHWEVDAIGFDGTRAYPTVSYHAQRLFSLHRCHEMLPFTLTGAPPLPGRPELAGVHVSVGRAADGALILKVVNLDTELFTCTIELAAPVAAVGEVIVLTAASLEDGNSLNHPRRVEPRVSTEAGFSDRFTRSFPAGSLTILRLNEISAG